MTDSPLVFAESRRFSDGAGRYFALMGLAFAALAAIVIFNPTTIDGHQNPLFKEDGLVEQLSPVLYGACILLILGMGGVRFGLTRGRSLLLMLLVLTLRELDFHARFTTMSITKMKFYISDTVPLHEKIAGVIVLGLLVWLVLALLRTYARPVLKGMMRLEPTSLATVIALMLIASSEWLDGARRYLAMVGITLDRPAINWLGALEETLELGIPVFAFLAIWAYFGTRRDATDRKFET
ncbi:hypothetical protein [Manganibacter manganicus]|uniref:Uncharacterized protein n=1 Tax=Manganibacter manganicus TaxID=1873176 RepID=A0A1V8RTX1_9HYPH|nr:hypothetical protein [Pseudaminobacter manganicus]OQM76642.1 hypothetical protein BFN67_13510 [Pseudaminobacter manganicus]